MMIAAARAVARCAVRSVPPGGPAPLLPPVGAMREAAVEVAVAVALTAVEDEVAPAASEAAIRAAVAATRWSPHDDG